MKKRNFLALTLVLSLALGLAPAASAATVPSGSGTESDPFRITSQEELEIISDFPSAHYVLMNDITLDSSWDVVGNKSGASTPTEADFQGVLDGNGYTIDLTDVPARQQTLIWYNHGTIRNLRVLGDISYYSDGYYGTETFGVLVKGNYGLIESCAAEGAIDLTVSGTIDTHPYLGGIAAYNFSSGTVRDCYGRMALSLSDPTRSMEYSALFVNGVVGYNYGTVQNCYSVSTYDGPTGTGFSHNEGGVVDNSSDGTSTGCYYDQDVLGYASAGDGVDQFGKSTTAMKMQVNYTGWDFNNVWYIDPALNNGYPVLRVDQRFDIPAGTPSAGNSSGSQSGGTTITDDSGQIEITFGDNSSSTSTPSSGGIKVTVNGQYLTFDQPPVAQNNRVLVPMRAIFEALGAQVEWNPENQTILGYRASDDRAILMELNIPTMARQVGGGDIYLIDLDVAPTAMNNRTLVPVRAIAESFNCTVDWDQTSQTVIITD